MLNEYYRVVEKGAREVKWNKIVVPRREEIVQELGGKFVSTSSLEFKIGFVVDFPERLPIVVHTNTFSIVAKKKKRPESPSTTTSSTSTYLPAASSSSVTKERHVAKKKKTSHMEIYSSKKEKEEGSHRAICLSCGIEQCCPCEKHRYCSFCGSNNLSHPHHTAFPSIRSSARTLEEEEKVSSLLSKMGVDAMRKVETFDPDTEEEK